MPWHEYTYFRYSKNCKEYKNALKDLVKDWNIISTTNKNAVAARFDAFSDKYLMGFNLWHRRFNEKLENEDLRFLYQKAHYHFFFSYSKPVPILSKHINANGHYFSGAVFPNFEFIFNFEPEPLIFPHIGLKQDMDTIKKYSTAPIHFSLIKKYKKALKIYERINEIKDGDDEEWFQRIQEWKDEEFVVQSIEFRIGRYLQYNEPRRNLWKLYIEYLRPRNPKAMLGIYSRYCRYFFDDKRMKKKFDKEAAKFGIIPGEELLDFQEFASFPKNGFQSLLKTCKKKSLKTKLCLDTVLPQNFSFPDPMIHYFTKTNNYEILHKLFMLCKFFFIKQSTPICHRLILGQQHHQIRSNIIFDKQALTVSEISPDLEKIKNLIVSNHFLSSSTQKLFHQIRPCIYKFNVKYLTLSGRILLKDYKFMTESKTIKVLTFTFVTVILSENSRSPLAQLEDVMETLPNAYSIDFTVRVPSYASTVTINSKTFEKLLKMPRNCSLQWFRFRGCNETFDPNGCFNFIKSCKKDEEKCRFSLLFKYNIDPDFKKTSTSAFNKLLNEYNENENNKIECGFGNFGLW